MCMLHKGDTRYSWQICHKYARVCFIAGRDATIIRILPGYVDREGVEFLIYYAASRLLSTLSSGINIPGNEKYIDMPR